MQSLRQPNVSVCALLPNLAAGWLVSLRPSFERRYLYGMAQSVKGAVARTRISSKHQVTIAKQAFDAAGLHAGDVVAVRAVGPGRVELTRLDELFAKHRGRVKGDSRAHEAVERLRDEWL